ncbi:MAG: pirin family protein [Burkholderiales bacterium]|nr:pirin family protein [Nitrosomonas sp.]MCP5276248.1 pirin family protein [Burkholderiales bacterium]
MNINIHRAHSRGITDLGWLNSRHTYSFSSYQNPERIKFGTLRVINDDAVQPGMGFAMHSHENMEIISIPLSGALQHKDSMGNHPVIQSGEVQIMSAGTGISHSEYNHSTTENVNFLQIWILPKVLNIPPRYAQKRFDPEKRQNRFQLIVSPDCTQDSISINQDAYFSLAEFDEERTINYSLHRQDNGVYIFVIAGAVTLGDICLNERDGAEIMDSPALELRAQKGTHLLCMEIPLIPARSSSPN